MLGQIIFALESFIKPGIIIGLVLFLLGVFLRKRKRKRIFLFALSVICIIFTYNRQTTTFLYVLTLPRIADPVAFARTFDPHKNHSVPIETAEGFTFIMDRYYYSKSPLYPYPALTEQRSLNTCPPGSTVPDNRVILVDRNWNVFWISIAACTPETEFKELYFGPFKLPK